MTKKLRLVLSVLSGILVVISSASSYGKTIPIIGKLKTVPADTGGSVYTNTPVDTIFTGFIDDFSFNGVITNGTATTVFSCCRPESGLTVSQGELDSELAAVLNAVTGTSSFFSGQMLDAVEIVGDVATPAGGFIEVGLNYFFSADTFANESNSNYPFEPEVPLAAAFFVHEADASQNDLYRGIGQLLELPPSLNTGRSGEGATDATIASGISVNAGSSYTSTVKVGERVTFNAVIQPDSAHLGENLDVVVAAEIAATGEIFLLTEAGALVPYNPSGSFSVFTSIAQAMASNTVTILNDFQVSTSEIGSYNLYVGYLVEGGSGDIFYTLEPAQFSVTDN